MRFIVSAILGTIVVLAMLLTALHLFDGKVDNASLRKGVEVTAIPSHSRLDVAELMREVRDDLPEVGERGEPLPRLPPPPPFELARPDITGFVQLVFTVQADGTATDIRVFGAAPTGYYEEQAIAVIASRRWDPGVGEGGQPASRQATEVVRFTLPPDAPRQRRTESP